jgi:alpha-beta hydrolase superfamily lysophospholipase
MVNVVSSRFETLDGVKLYVRKFLPESKPVAALLIVHGMSEHSGRYERFASRLAAAGVEVWAADMRGHGQTAVSENGAEKGGLLGHCADRDAAALILSDVHQLNSAIHESYPDIPLFLMGHSWGSFLVQGYIERYEEPKLAGCILSGTRGPDKGLMGARIILGGAFLSMLTLFRSGRSRSKLAAALADGAYIKAFRSRNAPRSSRTDYGWLSRDAEEVEAYIADPLCGKLPSLGFYRDLARLLQMIHKKSNMTRISHNLPLYIFAGSRDPAGDMGKSPRALVESYQKLGINDIAFVLYPEGRHEMLHETNYEEVEENLLSWIL